MLCNLCYTRKFHSVLRINNTTFSVFTHIIGSHGISSSFLIYVWAGVTGLVVSVWASYHPSLSLPSCQGRYISHKVIESDTEYCESYYGLLAKVDFCEVWMLLCNLRKCQKCVIFPSPHQFWFVYYLLLINNLNDKDDVVVYLYSTCDWVMRYIDS